VYHSTTPEVDPSFLLTEGRGQVENFPDFVQEMQEEIGKGMHECVQEGMPRRMASEDGGKSVQSGYAQKKNSRRVWASEEEIYCERMHEGVQKIPWWYHGLARGWPAAEVTEHAEPMVGWKGEHP
jgi:hypothetical protein